MKNLKTTMRKLKNIVSSLKKRFNLTIMIKLIINKAYLLTCDSPLSSLNLNSD